MSIENQILDFIHRPDSGRFEELAKALFAYQFNHVEPYREFCRCWGGSPASVKTVADITPVSTAAFKYVKFCAGLPQRIFRTSGTTHGRDRRGEHFMPGVQLYRASALAHLERMMFPDRCRPWMLALHPVADRMPESSLSQMISWCIESFGGARSLCCATPQQVDSRAAFDFLREAEAAAEPICILGTTAALSAIFDYLRVIGARLRLAADSRVMDTGGPKGQSKPLTQAEVRAMAQQYLGISSPWVINEYGMTELSSQLYDATPVNCPGASEGVERVKVAPPWLKVIARDPASLRPVGPQEIGLLSFFDLANAGSVSALLTEDLGVVNAEGTVRVLGRLIGSDPRGCALGIEQFAKGYAHPRPLVRQGDATDSGIKKSALLSGALSPTGVRVGIGVASPPTNSSSLGQTSAKPEFIKGIAARLRAQADRKLAPQCAAEALAHACARWRDPDFGGRSSVLAASGAATGQSRALLDASLDALLAGFTPEAILDLVRRLGVRDRLIGFIMPGNVMGAGLHELVQALSAGACALVKPSIAEPLFFAEFQRTLQAIDSGVAARMHVARWDRSAHESTIAMAQACDRIVAFGEDDSITAIAALAGSKMVGFGSRSSGALLSREAIVGAQTQTLAAALARDACLFDQRGCLSLNHIVVEARSFSDARDFAELLAGAMAASARSIPAAATAPISEAAAARAAREDARWRRSGGAPVAMWEGTGLEWTVIFDPEAGFEPSPLCRTVCVSMIANESELRGRLAGAAGSLEGFAIADPANRLESWRAILREMGVSWLCAPGQLQSPPPSWPHGGGRFLHLMEPADG
ncbi:MAG TPA: acyl-CoA reductase [Candidatus Binataceae bacterium]|nr:acyl-CoA reductase [Candidatus Binataceae bacterium]